MMLLRTLFLLCTLKIKYTGGKHFLQSLFAACIMVAKERETNGLSEMWKRLRRV